MKTEHTLQASLEHQPPRHMSSIIKKIWHILSDVLDLIFKRKDSF